MCEAELILELPTARLVEVIPKAPEKSAAPVPDDQQKQSSKDTNKKDDDAGDGDGDDDNKTKEQAPLPDSSSPQPPPPVAKMGHEQFITRVEPGSLNVIAVRFTDEEIAAVQSEVGVEKHAVAAPGAPLLFILAGDYKIPIRAECPARLVPPEDPNSTTSPTRQYEFDVLGLQMRIVFSSETPLLLVEHFETVLLQQNALIVEQSQIYDPAAASAVSKKAMAAQPQWEQPDPSSQQFTEGNSLTTTQILEGMNTIGSGAASGLRSGALMLSKFITGGAQYIVENTDKRADADAVPVPQQWQSYVKSARVVSKGSVKVSTGVAKSLVGVTSVVSDRIAGRLRTAIKSDEEESDGVKAAKAVGLGLADNAVSIYEAATDAARTILVASSSSIASVVEHKMGKDAGSFVEDGLGMLQDGYDATRAASAVGARGIVKGAIKQTVRKTLDEEKYPTLGDQKFPVIAEQFHDEGAAAAAAAASSSSSSEAVAKKLDDDQ